MKDDLGERHDLARQEPAKVEALHAQLQAWRAAVGARKPTRNPDAQ